jgi:hypothetical protein
MLTGCRYDPPRPVTSSDNRALISHLPAINPTTPSTDHRRNHNSNFTSYSSVTMHKAADYQLPHLTKTPWELERHKKNSVWRRSKDTKDTKPDHALPATVFKMLPREVYDCIVEQLEQLHFGREQSCTSCYLKDLYNLSITSRQWDQVASNRL